MKHHAITTALAALLTLSAAYAVAAQTPAASDKAPTQRETIYGYTMMTDAERNDYRAKMHGAKSEQERQTVRDEHHKTMEARMAERGVDPGQLRGKGAGPMGPGAGMGAGAGPMGPGSGMGPGAGPGPGKGSGPGAGYGPGAGPRGPGNGPGPRGVPPQ